MVVLICFDNLSLVYNLGKHSINDIDNLYIPKEEEDYKNYMILDNWY